MKIWECECVMCIAVWSWHFCRWSNEWAQGIPKSELTLSFYFSYVWNQISLVPRTEHPRQKWCTNLSNGVAYRFQFPNYSSAFTLLTDFAVIQRPLLGEKKRSSEKTGNCHIAGRTEEMLFTGRTRTYPLKLIVVVCKHDHIYFSAWHKMYSEQTQVATSDVVYAKFGCNKNTLISFLVIRCLHSNEH